MRKVLIIVLLVALTLVGVSGSAGLTADLSKGDARLGGSEGLVSSFPTGSWNSGIQVQNLSSSAGTAVVTFYNESGTAVDSESQSLPANGSVNFYLPAISDASLPAGRYSAVVSSDVPVAAVANQANYSGLGMGDAYLGMSAGATEVSLPLVFHRFSDWYSFIAVQNTGSLSASVSLRFYPQGSATASLTKNATLASNASGYFDLTSSEYDTLGTFLGSVVITGTQSIVAVVNQTKDNGSFGGVQIYGGFTTITATRYIAPLVYKKYGGDNSDNMWTSGLTVQNKGSSSTTVTMTFRPTNTSGTYTKTIDIPANSAGTFYMPNYADIPAGVFGAAVIESSGNPIAVLVSHTRYTGAGLAAGYNAFPDGSGTRKVVIPQVFKRYSNWDSGVQVYNMGSASDTVYYSYSGTNVSGNWVVTQTVPANGSFNFYMPSGDFSFPSSSYGSVVITSTTQPIVAVVSSVKYANSVYMNYLGVNTNP